MPSSACDWSSDVCSSDRSEEHTSELQSRSDLVCRLLLENKKAHVSTTVTIRSRMTSSACSKRLFGSDKQEVPSYTLQAGDSHVTQSETALIAQPPLTPCA